jgi:hypothetical protein
LIAMLMSWLISRRKRFPMHGGFVRTVAANTAWCPMFGLRTSVPPIFFKKSSLVQWRFAVKDDRWIEIEDDFTSSSHHFASAVELFMRGGFDVPSLAGYSAGMAFMHAMQAGHTSLQNGLKRILSLLDEDLPAGESWPADLIRRVSRSTQKRPAILSTAISDFADETRRFRNIAVRSYDSFLPQYADSAVVAAENLSLKVLSELKAIQSIVDGPS